MFILYMRLNKDTQASNEGAPSMGQLQITMILESWVGGVLNKWEWSCHQCRSASTLWQKAPNLVHVRKVRVNGSVERWRDGEMERWRDGEMQRTRHGDMERGGEGQRGRGGESREWCPDLFEDQCTGTQVQTPEASSCLQAFGGGTRQWLASETLPSTRRTLTGQTRKTVLCKTGGFVDTRGTIRQPDSRRSAAARNHQTTPRVGLTEAGREG